MGQFHLLATCPAAEARGGGGGAALQEVWALGTLGQSLSMVLPEVSGWGCLVAITTPVCPGPHVISRWCA